MDRMGSTRPALAGSAVAFAEFVFVTRDHAERGPNPRSVSHSEPQRPLVTGPVGPIPALPLCPGFGLGCSCCPLRANARLWPLRADRATIVPAGAGLSGRQAKSTQPERRPGPHPKPKPADKKIVVGGKVNDTYVGPATPAVNTSNVCEGQKVIARRKTQHHTLPTRGTPRKFEERMTQRRPYPLKPVLVHVTVRVERSDKAHLEHRPGGTHPRRHLKAVLGFGHRGDKKTGDKKTRHHAQPTRPPITRHAHDPSLNRHDAGRPILPPGKQQRNRMHLPGTARPSSGSLQPCTRSRCPTACCSQSAAGPKAAASTR